MRLEYYSADKLASEILEIIGKHLDISEYKVFFFGSRTIDKGNEHSDVDVGIQGPERIPWKVMNAIKEELEELPTLYKIDIMDFYNAPEKFRRVIKEEREYIN
ncbi:MAG: nucleotidyltransferase family protein [Patescibacteria group bacterium]